MTYSAAKFLVALSNGLEKEMHCLTFDLDVKVKQNIDQYPLHHVTYAATKVASANGLGDTITRKHARKDYSPTLV